MTQPATLPVADPVTAEVSRLYEAFPYPAQGVPTLRTGFDARELLSRGALPRPEGAPLEILDAGCGRGVGLVAQALTHPEARVLGIDLSQAALGDARASIEARGLTNARLQRVDLMTLEGLEVPGSGFDVVHSSGVVHHLSDPVTGLRKLGEALAPHGVLSLMVYGALGRTGIACVARTLALWLDPEEPLDARLAASRMLVDSLARPEAPGCPFDEAKRVPDVEFVDRYLHPHALEYDVPRLFDLIEDAGLRFLSWSEPERWSVERWIPAGPLRESVAALPDRERFALIEQLARPAALECCLGRPENDPRRHLADDAWVGETFATHPETRFLVETRNLWGASRIESVAYARGRNELVEVDDPRLGKAVWILSTQNRPFRGVDLIEALVAEGLTPPESLAVLQECLRRGLVYRPHGAEVD